MESRDPITINAHRMNITFAHELALRKGFNVHEHYDTYQDHDTGVYRKRVFLKVYKTLSYAFRFMDWTPEVRIVTQNFEVTPQFVEDCITMRMIAQQCWEDE